MDGQIDNIKGKGQNKKPTIKQRKELFLQELNASLGIATVASAKSGVPRQTAYDWRKRDAKFAKKWDEVTEVQADYVENGLLGKIRAGDTAAIIFYLKTKGKNRGYSERLEVNASVSFSDVLKAHSIVADSNESDNDLDI